MAPQNSYRPKKIIGRRGTCLKYTVQYLVTNIMCARLSLQETLDLCIKVLLKYNESVCHSMVVQLFKLSTKDSIIYMIVRES